MADCLVLDADYMPKGFCSYKTAVKLWYEGRASIVKEDEEGAVLRSPSFEMGMPRVIAVRGRWSKRLRFSVPCSRSNIYLRDNGRCQYCGNHVTTQEFQIEHVVPRCQGGKTEWNNIVCSCMKCNRSKAGLTPKQAGMSFVVPLSKQEKALGYTQRPYVPKTNDPRFNFKLHIKKIRKEWAEWENWLYAEKASYAYWNIELEK